jgi:hypothetical protein
MAIQRSVVGTIPFGSPTNSDETLATLHQPKMVSFLILSFKLILQIFLRHFIWETINICSRSTIFLAEHVAISG